MHFRLIEAGSVPTIAPMTASDAERARNDHSGKWRSSDSAPDRVRVLRKGLRLSQPAMARVLGISQRKLSQLENAARAPRPETTRRLVEVERLHDALVEVIEADAIPGWLEQPNPGFGGASPLQLIERGETDRLWQMIYLVRSGHPG